MLLVTPVLFSMKTNQNLHKNSFSSFYDNKTSATAADVTLPSLLTPMVRTSCATLSVLSSLRVKKPFAAANSRGRQRSGRELEG